MPPDVSVPKARRAPLQALAKQLGGATLAAEVRLACEDQLAYLKKFRRRMHDINVDGPRRGLGWLALVEGLCARKRAVELDWKHEADDVATWVKGLAGAAGKRAMAAVLADPELLERRTDEALELCGGALAGAGLALLELEKQSDSYVVMVVPAREVAALVALAKRGGERVTHVTGRKLAAIAKERKRAQQREEARARSVNRWTQLAQHVYPRSTDGVLWTLRHHPYPVEDIRAAAGDAPARDRALVAMALALHDERATKVAKTTRDPTLCLRALRYLSEHRTSSPGERLGAAAILVERLRIAPGTGRLQQQVIEACNLFAEPKDADRALASLRAADRARLARIADAYLKGAKHQSPRWNDAYRALRSVGDRDSIAAIEASRAHVWPAFKNQPIAAIDEALARIAKRA